MDFTIYLPEQYAREVVACDPDVRAVLFGDDGGGSKDDEIRHLWVGPEWPIAQSYGVSAALFAQTIHDSDLYEDPDGSDELYARVSYWDCHTGLRRYFQDRHHQGQLRLSGQGPAPPYGCQLPRR